MQNAVGFVRPKHNNIWLILSCFIVLVGLYGVVQVFLHGQEESYGITREVPWGLLIIGYSFFVGITLGTAVVGALAHVFKIDSFNIMSKKLALVSVSSLIAGFFIIYWDLAGPYDLQVLRLVVYFAEFKITSPIWWLVVLYASELPLLAFEVYFLLSQKENSAFYASLIGTSLSIVAYGTMALVFDANSSRPLWHTSSFALFFIISAIAGGFGVVLVMIFLNNVTQKYKKSIIVLSKTLFFLLTFMLVIDFWNVVINSYSSDVLLGATMRLFIGKGVLAYNFYFYEIILGIILPMFLLLVGRFKSSVLAFISGILTIVGLFFSRYDAVIGGQLLSRPSESMKFVLHNYSVSASEISIFVGSIGVLFFVYFLGAKFFNLEESTL